MARKSSKKTASEPLSQRQLRVGEMLRHALSDLLVRGEVHDDVLAAHVVTVPEVRMSPDLRLATAYVMPLGGIDGEEVVKALDRNKRYIRGRLAQSVSLKFSPDIRFHYDDTFDEVSRIDELFRSPKVRKDIDN